MQESRFREEGSLDRFENKLFNPKTKIDNNVVHRSIREITKDDIPTSWGGNDNVVIVPKKSSGKSLGFSMLVGSMAMLLIAVIFASWNIWQKRNMISNSNIDIVVQIKPYIEGGEESPVSISVQNRNNVTLIDTNLILSYEKGVGGQDQQEKVNNKIKFGDIKQNEIKTDDEKIQIYGSEGESRAITVTLEYKVAGSGGSFNKIVSTDVILKTPPVSVHVDGPDHVANSQVSKYIIRVKNNSSKTSDNVLVKATFPAAFTILSSEPENKARNMNAWILSGLAQGEERQITIEGSAKASVGEHLSIKTQVGSQINDSYDIGTVYSYDLKDVVISDSDLKISINAENNSGKASSFRFGDKVKLSLNYENISGRALDNVEIKGVVSGNSFDVNSVVAQNGAYSINNKAVFWNKDTVPEFTNLAAGAKGVLYVTFDIPQTGDSKSFVRFDVQGSSVGADSAVRDIKTNISQTWQIQGETSLTSQTIYVGSSLLNSGPIPPRISIPTTYVLRFYVSTHQSLKKGTVSFNLPTYVTWLGKTNMGSAITYSPSTRTVTWDVSGLYRDSSRMLEAQVSVVPVQSHLGTSPSLTSGINFSSQEDFGATHNIVNKPLTTVLSDDETSAEKWVVIAK